MRGILSKHNFIHYPSAINHRTVCVPSRQDCYKTTLYGPPKPRTFSLSHTVQRSVPISFRTVRSKQHNHELLKPHFLRVMTLGFCGLDTSSALQRAAQTSQSGIRKRKVEKKRERGGWSLRRRVEKSSPMSRAHFLHGR